MKIYFLKRVIATLKEQGRPSYHVRTHVVHRAGLRVRGDFSTQRVPDRFHYVRSIVAAMERGAERQPAK